MDKNTIGLKKKKVINKQKWVPCSDYKTASEGLGWFRRLFLTRDDFTRCVHGDVCENWEYSEMKRGCSAGYWD